MMLPGDDPLPVVGRHVDAPAENLLFTVYRCWMAGEETRDVGCWEIGWNAICKEMPGVQARGIYGEFHHFMRVLTASAPIGICWRRAACRSLCRDECLVLAVLEAAQRGDVYALIGAAHDLVGDAELGPLLEAAQSLADALAARGLFLSPVTVLAGRSGGGAASRPQ